MVYLDIYIYIYTKTHRNFDFDFDDDDDKEVTLTSSRECTDEASSHASVLSRRRPCHFPESTDVCSIYT